MRCAPGLKTGYHLVLPYFRSNHQLILLDLLANQHVVRPRLVMRSVSLSLPQSVPASAFRALLR